jgi:hypothetical protein
VQERDAALDLAGWPSLRSSDQSQSREIFRALTLTIFGFSGAAAAACFFAGVAGVAGVATLGSGPDITTRQAGLS